MITDDAASFFVTETLCHCHDRSGAIVPTMPPIILPSKSPDRAVRWLSISILRPPTVNCADPPGARLPGLPGTVLPSSSQDCALR
jgi:hypothetical protein